jgi:hypothetical protein
MEHKPMTYRQLDQILTRLGFTRERIQQKWLYYEHPESKTEIILIEKKPTDMVRPTDAFSAQFHLVAKGLASEEELARWLKRKTPVKKAKR